MKEWKCVTCNLMFTYEEYINHLIQKHDYTIQMNKSSLQNCESENQKEGNK